MTRTLRAIAVATAILAAAYASQAEEAKKPRDQRARPADFQKADTNKDGKITFEELHALRPKISQEQFQKLDRDHDGALTPDDRHAAGDEAKKILLDGDKNGDKKVTFEELKAVRPEVTQERFARLDRNHDGAIDANDRQADGTPGQERERFKKTDANNDGKISFEEIVAAKPKVTKEYFAKWDANGDGFLTPNELAQIAGGKRDGMKAAGMGRAGDGPALDKLLASDANGDGSVTFEEVTASKPGFPREAFDRFDRNKDGRLTKDDAPASK